MSKPIDLTGQRFGRLTVQELAGRDKGGRATWRCLCDCGNTSVVIAYSLRGGHTTSCGCLRRERAREKAATHRGSKTRLFNIWEQMKKRCGNPSNSGYKNYGGRGITVCEEWAQSFEAFRDWAHANGYRDDLTIDRISNDGNYCPENCHWVTTAEQNSNRRFNHNITHNGETHTLAQWARLTGVKEATLWRRIKRGWSVEKALTTKVRRKDNARNSKKAG